MAEIDDVIVANVIDAVRIFAEEGDCPSTRVLDDWEVVLPKDNLADAAAMLATIANQKIKCKEGCTRVVDIKMGERGAPRAVTHIEGTTVTTVSGWVYKVTIVASCDKGEGSGKKEKQGGKKDNKSKKKWL
ncbi:MAG: hypothetical protein JO257_08355 [Deltaproteobacteria bacterium]|nr:hypothetical protein [Deltaproteobacteria bacterium]